MTTQEGEEVNNGIEKIYVEPSDDTELVEPEEPTDDLIVEQTDTESSSSEDEQPAETEEQETEVEQESTPEPVSEDRDGNIKRLPDETPREFALRLEVTRLKRERRGERKESLKFDEPKTEVKEDVLSKYNSEEIKNLEEIVDVLAQKKGWVRKTDIVQDRFEDIKDSWLDEHPEYLPEHDKDDILWKALTEEIKMYRSPQNPKELRKILDRAHTSVFGIRPDTALKSVKAQQEKIKVASHAGNQAKSNSTSKQIDLDIVQNARQHLKGFSDEEINELLT
jgi:hypothetical protein